MNVIITTVAVSAVTVIQMSQSNADTGSFDLYVSNSKEKWQLRVG